MRRIDTLVIHHSASPEGSVAMFRAEHIARGFGDIGYHYIIGNGRLVPDGKLCVGRPESEKGCGVWGNNTGKLHICLVGNFEKYIRGYTGRPSLLQLSALGGWLERKSMQYGLDSTQTVGHKEIALPGHATVCPGSQMPLGVIRSWLHLRLAHRRWPDGSQNPGSLDHFLVANGWLKTTA